MKAKIAKRGASALAASDGSSRRSRVDKWWHSLVCKHALGTITEAEKIKLERLTNLRRLMDGPTETRHQRIHAWNDFKTLKALRRLARSAKTNGPISQTTGNDHTAR